MENATTTLRVIEYNEKLNKVKLDYQYKPLSRLYTDERTMDLPMIE